MKASQAFWQQLVFAVLLVGALPLQAETGGFLQLTDRLAVAAPEVMRLGQCVRYQEGGLSFLGRESGFWLEGTVLELTHEYHQLENCPKDWVPGSEPPSREALLQREGQMPCKREDDVALPPRMEVTKASVSVQRWETPWSKRWETKGRLFRGKYLDQPLSTGITLQLNAALLTPCKTL